MSFEAMLQAQDVAMIPAQELYPEANGHLHLTHALCLP